MSAMGENEADMQEESERRKGLKVPAVFGCLLLVVPEPGYNIDLLRDGLIV